jgi:DNA invertase Pin-like site-specific DNA recombinase
LCERCYRVVRRGERGEGVNMPADESRDRLWEMRNAGMTNQEIVLATGCSNATVSVLLYGVKGKHRKMVNRKTHDRIMATPIRQVAS